jgi:hypothetical protein
MCQCSSASLTAEEVLFSYDSFVVQDKYFCVCETSAEYRPRNPEDHPLYGVVSRHLETYLTRQSESERPVPGFVERELRSFLDCLSLPSRPPSGFAFGYARQSDFPRIREI